MNADEQVPKNFTCVDPVNMESQWKTKSRVRGKEQQWDSKGLTCKGEDDPSQKE